MSISKNVKMIKEICLYREVCNILQLRCSVFWIHVGVFLVGVRKNYFNPFRYAAKIREYVASQHDEHRV